MVQIRNVTKEQIIKALEETNKTFEGNVIFNRFDQIGKTFHVTIKVKDSRGLGAKLGFPHYDHRTECMIKKGRRTTSACWHVWGVFFDCLFDLAPDAVILSAYYLHGKITKESGNWHDKNTGSPVFSYFMSDACECEERIGDIPQKYPGES